MRGPAEQGGVVMPEDGSWNSTKMVPGIIAGDHCFAAGRIKAAGRRGLDQRHTGGLRALGALTDFELNTLVLVEGLEATGLDLRVVHEDITIGVIRGNEAEALFSVEPLDGSLCHLFLLIVELV